MRCAATPAYYPEECDANGADCLHCVRTTATAMRELTSEPTREWASAVFHRLYTHAGCRPMEHSFLWACGSGTFAEEMEEAEKLGPVAVRKGLGLIQISAVPA